MSLDQEPAHRSFNLALDLFEHGRSSPARPALQVGQRILSYGELSDLASRLAWHLASCRGSGRVGVLASRSVMAAVGILGTAWSGATYVPLSLKLPEGRLLDLLTLLDLDALLVDARGAALLTPQVLEAAPNLVILADDAADIGEPLLRLGELGSEKLPEPARVGPDHVAYVEFTSGSTGTPKGVMVPAGAVMHYLEAMQRHMRLGPQDRAAETCDITFDLSVHNMFLCWRAGAALHVMTALDMVGPAQFIRRHAITAWLSVPSVIAQMRRMRSLAPGSLPSLGWSLFCGEPLPLAAAEAWAAAAPNSVVENHYGPTEATVACLVQPLTMPAVVTPSRGIVAIGRPYPGMQAAILDGALQPVGPGVPGELALSGTQLALGYFGMPELTEARFPTLDGTRWYLTGDLASVDADGVFHHLGRLDNQVKIQGNRVELEEIEMHLREVSGSDLVAAVPWPLFEGLAAGLVGFAAAPGAEPIEIQKRLASRLPGYMAPARVHLWADLPLNANGKVDRKALAAWLGESA